MKVSPEEAISVIKMRMMTASFQALGEESEPTSLEAYLRNKDSIDAARPEWNPLTPDEDDLLQRTGHSVAHDFIDMAVDVMKEHQQEHPDHETNFDVENLCNLMATFGRVIYLAGMYAAEEEHGPKVREAPVGDKLMLMSAAMNGWRSWAFKQKEELGQEMPEDNETAKQFNAALMSKMTGMSHERALRWLEDLTATSQTTLEASMAMLDEPPEGEDPDYFQAAVVCATVCHMAGIWATLEWVKE